MDLVFDSIKAFLSAFHVPSVVWGSAVVFVWSYYQLRQRFALMRSAKTEKISRIVAEISNNRIRNKYVIEQLVLDRYGCLISYPVVSVLLNTKNPSMLLSSFALAKSYYETNEVGFKLKEKYNTNNLYWYGRLHFLLYLVFSFSFVIGVYLLYSTPQHFPVLIMLAVGSLSIAWVSLELSIGADEALIIEKYISKNNIDIPY